MEAEAPGEAGQALGAGGVRAGSTLGGRTQPQGVAVEAKASPQELRTRSLEGAAAGGRDPKRTGRGPWGAGD